MRTLTVLISVSFAVSLTSTAIARELVTVAAPDHVPLYFDPASVKRDGAKVSLTYVIDIPKVVDGREVSGAWTSAEVEAVLDCSANTFLVGKLVAHAEARAQGAVLEVSPPFPGDKPRTISAKSTWAYLSAQVCKRP